MPVSPTALLLTSASGMLARQFEIDVAAHNLANLNTPGFRPARADFQEQRASEVAPSLLDGPFRGTSLAATKNSQVSGALRPGDSALQLAIDGDGFFQITQADGTLAYTRDGRFQRDSDGELVTSAGHRLVWDGALPADASQYHVNPDGTVMARRGDAWEQAGQIQIARFANPSGLTGVGENLFSPNDNTGTAETGQPQSEGLGRLLSGVVESSAASIVDEMTYMILAQRAYGMSLRAFQQADEMLAMAIRVRP